MGTTKAYSRRVARPPRALPTTTNKSKARSKSSILIVKYKKKVGTTTYQRSFTNSDARDSFLAQLKKKGWTVI